VTTPSILQEDRLQFIRWTFTLDAQHIERLKQRIVHLGEAALGRSSDARSTHDLVAAATRGWSSDARSTDQSTRDLGAAAPRTELRRAILRVAASWESGRRDYDPGLVTLVDFINFDLRT